MGRNKMSLRGKWNFTEESTEESTKHRIWKGGEKGAELPDHAQGKHEGSPVLDHPAAADLQEHQRWRFSSTQILHALQGKCDKTLIQNLYYF